MGGASFGKYRLLAELGNGGMADVFLAVQAGPQGLRFRKLMVVKRLRRALADEPEFVAMLIDEARIAARLNHPNVVQTNEVGEVDGQFFIAMEYLDGQPLHRVQNRRLTRRQEGKPCPITREHQFLVVLDTLAGLHHAHELKDFDGTPLDIVHRDITPHNIFVTYEGQVKVVDFGIAKAAGRSSETREGVVKGKVRYMAPEQAAARTIDRRADIFSVGVILWEAAVGRRLWSGMDDVEIIQALLSCELPASPRTLDETIPESIDRICQRAMSPKADERYATAEEFRAELEQAMADTGTLLDARRKLAPAMAELFKDRRDELRVVIDAQLSALEITAAGQPGASGSFPPVKVPMDTASSGNLPSTTPSRSNVAIPTTAAPVSDDPPTVLAERPPPPSPLRQAAVVGVSIVAVAAAVFAAFPRQSATGAPQRETTVAELALRITGSPGTARVSIDDGMPLPLPVDMRVPRDAHDHRLRVDADGFIGKTDLVRFDRDVTLSYDLAPAPAANASSNAKRARASSPTVVTITVPRPASPTPPRNEPAAAVQAPAPPTTGPSNATTDSRKKAQEQLDKGDPWMNH
jgi:serine/threonine-protein kinase